MEKKTLVLGASEKPWRYSHMALQLLAAKGVPAVAVGQSDGKVGAVAIETGQPAYPDVHTITMYVGPEHQGNLEKYILSLRPERIIFNPGTENRDLAEKARATGIEVVEACTLVMLRTGQF
jgi:uncharacterized protein